MGKGQELLDAAREGDRKIVEKILAQITKRSGTLITSLRRGASVNVQDDNGYTPLHHACLRGHEDIVHLLLSVDASPCIVDKKGATPLHLAAWKGDLKIVNMLLSHSNQPVNIDQLTSDQETALIIASQFGFEDVVAQLLARGADVTIQNKKGDTALDLAAHYGRLEVVQQLLYAKPHLVDRYRNLSGRNLLFPDTPLHRAAKHGHEEVVALLIAAGVDPNIKTINGTALHEAAYVLRDSVVRVLLSRGTDLKACDNKGRTVMDILADFPNKATKKVRKAIADRANGFDSDGFDDVPSFPLPHRPPRSPSDFYEDERTKAPVTPNITNPLPIMSSSHTSSLTENHPQSFVKKLASKYLGIKAKFNSAPNVSNMSGLEPEVTLKTNGARNSTHTMLIGNSKFFKRISKKDDTGDIICNDEFDTISLDRLGTLERTSIVNRSNRSCPGFKISLPNISENIEPGDSHEPSIISNEPIVPSSSTANTITTTSGSLNIFEPRSEIYASRKSNCTSVSEVNECYEAYEFSSHKDRLLNTNEPIPLPRKATRTTTTEKTSIIYENIVIENNNTIPKPAIRTHINTIATKDQDDSIIYENFTPKSLEIVNKPNPPKRSIFKIKGESEVENNNTLDSSPSISRSSTLSSGSMSDETNLEDILLSQKSKSFKHKAVIRTESSMSALSLSSGVTEASALEHVDCSDKPLYTTMTGTLPSKKPENVPKKKVLFRHKTFSTIDADKSLTDAKVSTIKKDFLKENLVNYHIRGTGHCIYKAPTVKEFLEVFNKETLYSENVESLNSPSRRASYFETTICFCKPAIPKFYKSAEDLLLAGDTVINEGKAKIDTLNLLNTMELNSTSFKCFCDDESCKFHVKKRESPNNLVVKFSAINKSISTPNITLATTPVYEMMRKNMTFPTVVHEEPYAVVEIKDIISKDVNNRVNNNNYKTIDSTFSTVSSSSGQQYSVKDVAEVLSLKDENSISSNNTSVTSGALSDSLTVCTQRQSTSSELSSHTSLQSCISSSTMASDMSFKSCIAESDSDDGTLHSDDSQSDTDTVKSDSSLTKRPWVHSDSFNYGSKKNINVIKDIKEESDASSEGSLEVGCELGVASLECGVGRDVCSGSGRRWDEADGTSEGDALSVSSAASSSAPHHLAHHHDFNKISPTPPKKPPRRNLSVSPTHANSPSSAYSYELRIHARSQDDLDDLQGSKHYLKHGRSVDQYVDSKSSYEEYPRVAPIPNPRPSLKNRSQPVAITAMYENVVVKEQNPRRKLRRNNFEQNYEAQKLVEAKPRKFSAQKSSLESLLDESPTNFERYYDGGRVQIPLSPTHYNQPPTPEHPPPSARQAENSIHERIRPLSQEYKRRSMLRDSYTDNETTLLRAVSAASVASGATDRSGNTDCVEEYVCEVPFAGLFKGSTTTLDGIGLRPMPAERPKTLRKLKSVYDASPTDPPQRPINNGNQDRNGMEEEVRRRSNTSSSTHSGDKSLSILSPFDEQEEWAKISEIMASFGSKLVRESVFVSELEQEFTSRLGLSCSESSLSPSVASTLGLWLSGLGLQDYEQLFIDGGYDDFDFINGVIDENDLREMGVDEADRSKIIEASKQLPSKITEISNNHNNNQISKHQNPYHTESVEQWLKSINLDQYYETFRKHLYSDMDRVRRIWEVELTEVLEIRRPGHRKRILASVSGQQNGPANSLEVINADLGNLKSNLKQNNDMNDKKLSENLKAVPPPVVPLLAPPGGETLKRSKKNRPAPQPPRPSDLEIRAPSELMVGVPGALKTQWKHQPFVLVTGAVTYVANYLGSTVVKELKGTESTKKSIQKLKKTTKEPRDSPDIILSISYRGVKFLNTITRELVCEHEIRNIHCACQDADDLTHFAYITKDHSTKSHYCHVFCVATMDQATEVILTLGEAFEVAYQMALREQANRSRVTQSQPHQYQPHAKTPTHDPMTTTTKEKPNLNHGRSHSITEIKLNGHQLKLAPIPASLSNEDFQLSTRNSDGSKSPRTPLLKAPMASTEEL